MFDSNNVKENSTDDFIKIQDLAKLCLRRWQWFVISLTIATGIALYITLTTPPSYVRSASVMIKTEGRGSSSLGGDLSNVTGLGVFSSATNVSNEMAAIQSPAIMLDVVRKLQLNISYVVDGRFHEVELYGKNLPVKVEIPHLKDTDFAYFAIKMEKGGKLSLSNFIRNMQEDNKVIQTTLSEADSVPTLFGNIRITPTPYFTGEEDYTIHVYRSDLLSATNSFQAGLSASFRDDETTIIDLKYVDVSKERAEDVLAAVIEAYNESWVRDKNQVAVASTQFITERLEVIGRELGNVDSDISTYKSQNLIPDVKAASQMYMTQANDAGGQIMLLNNQLYMARYVRDYITKDRNSHQLLPANSGMGSAAIEKQIAEFNEKLLQRNNLVANSSTQNPLVVELDQVLAALRTSIVASVDNQINTLNTQIRSLQESEQKSTARIASSPSQAKYLLSIERQQKVKESLYLYLLQKREENELSQAFTAYNTRVITPPTGSNVPASPIKSRIFMIAWAVGLLIPVAVIFVIDSSNSKVRGRKDIKHLHIPFVGEIPLQGKRNWRGKVITNLPENQLVVKQSSNNLVNEAFRVLRTNLEFMVSSSNGKVIMTTSANPGSGKTFVTMNLAASLSVKQKKVLVIDLDMRRASLSEYVNSPKRGVANYLAGLDRNWQELVVSISGYSNLDVLPVGAKAPNPTELLFMPQLEQLLQEVKSQYDYIFIDCPPVEIVADASIISQWVDTTLFVIRVGLFEREMLGTIDEYYSTKKYPNMCLVLNASDFNDKRYGYHVDYRSYIKEE